MKIIRQTMKIFGSYKQKIGMYKKLIGSLLT